MASKAYIKLQENHTTKNWTPYYWNLTETPTNVEIIYHRKLIWRYLRVAKILCGKKKSYAELHILTAKIPWGKTFLRQIPLTAKISSQQNFLISKIFYGWNSYWNKLPRVSSHDEISKAKFPARLGRIWGSIKYFREENDVCEKVAAWNMKGFFWSGRELQARVRDVAIWFRSGKKNVHSDKRR